MTSRMHFILDGLDPYEDVGVEVSDIDAERACLDIRLNGDVFSLSGPVADVMTVASRLFQLTKTATDNCGEECSICGKRGVNRGSLPVAVGNGHHVHLGCAEDEESDRRAYLRSVD